MLDEIAESLRPHGIEAVCRLVENDHLLVVKECLRQTEPLEVPLGELPHALVAMLVESQQIDHGELQRVVAPRSAPVAAVASYIVTIVGDTRTLLEIFPAAAARGGDEYELPPLDLRELNAGLAALQQRGLLLSSLRPAHSVLEQHFREAVSE